MTKFAEQPTQCRGCPWRDMDNMRKEFPLVVEHALIFDGNFVCHERLGGCPGPRLALVEKVTTQMRGTQ